MVILVNNWCIKDKYDVYLHEGLTEKQAIESGKNIAQAAKEMVYIYQNEVKIYEVIPLKGAILERIG